MHLARLDRQGWAGGIQSQPAQGLVLQLGRGDDQRRPRGHLPSACAAAVVPDAARLRLFTGLSLPRLATRDAHQADWDRPVQVRRAAAQCVDQIRAQSRLLEARQALRRCHRDAHHRKPLDANSGLRRRRVRHDLRSRHHGAADEGRAGASAQGRVPARPHQRQHQSGGQCRRPAVRQSEDPQSHGAGDRSPGLHRHSDRGQGGDGCRHAAGPGGAMGAARPRSCQAARLRQRRAKKSGAKRARSWPGSATGRASR